MADPPRVLLADGDRPTRAGVRALLERSGFEVCGEASSRGEAVQLAQELRPHVCLIDVELPGGGIASAGEITTSIPGTAVVMLTLSQSEEDVFAALRAGASGYLAKDANPTRLPDALRGVLRGEAALPRLLTARVIEEFRRSGQRRVRVSGGDLVELTERELEVLALLRRGFTTAAAAESMGISEVTVRRHVSGVLKKLEVPDRASALRLLEG